jgi:PPK2 family polyphosphate:nucleotide phosphotransferase
MLEKKRLGVSNVINGQAGSGGLDDRHVTQSVEATGEAWGRSERVVTTEILNTMNTKEVIEKARKLAIPFRITNGEKFRLKDIDPGDTLGFQSEDKPRAKEALAIGIGALAELQDRLYAQDKWAVLVIFQAMDAAGKDGAIKHVMSGVNPQGCQVFSFKSPSAEDLDHDYLWRCAKCLPNRGHIGIFNRSYYEETLVVRVHPEFLAKQKIPASLVTQDIWKERFHDIRSFERYLARNGIVVVKFFLHVSRKEQKQRFLERAETPEKNWKFSASDMAERSCWDEYQDAYEDTIRNTATKDSPWYVVPADNKWFTRVVVGAAVIDTLASLDLAYPKVDKERLKEIAAAKRALLRSK